MTVQYVEEVFERVGRVLNLHAGGVVIGTTAEHPFWLAGKGWIIAGEIVEGDVLVGHDGQETRVDEVFDTGCVETVYNLRVSEEHTYFVGDASWGWSAWAHNAYAVITQYQTSLIRFGHWSIEIQDGQQKLHTHQTGVPGSDTAIQDISNGGVTLGTTGTERIEIDDPQAAMTLQRQLIAEGNRGAYHLYLKSCVSHVSEVLASAKITSGALVPPAIDKSSEQWKLLKRILDGKIT